MELSDYVINQYYHGSHRLYHWKENQFLKLNESILPLQRTITGDIMQIVVSNNICYFQLKDNRKYIYEKSNKLDMLVLYSINYEYVNMLNTIVKSGCRVIEIGACWGYYTILLSKLVGECGYIHAYEPQSKAYDLLLKNCMLNQCNNISFHRVAITNVNGHSILHQLKDRLFFTSISYNFEDYSNDEECETRKLDDCMDERCDIIIADIEGAECLFLDGACNYISKYSPIIIMEIFKIGLIANNYSIQDIYKRLPSYKAFIAKGGLFIPTYSIDRMECEDVFFFKIEHIEKFKNLFNDLY